MTGLYLWARSRIGNSLKGGKGREYTVTVQVTHARVPCQCRVSVL